MNSITLRRGCLHAATPLLLALAGHAQLSWTELHPPVAPAARFAHATAFAIPAYESILFGGFDGAQAFGDTWSWTGSSWQLRATTGPAPRYDHAMRRFDIDDDSLLLFGGRTASGALLGDTWLWNGAGWSQLASAIAPSPRHGHALACDEFEVPRIVLFGGRTAQGCSDETWIHANGLWTPIVTAHRPPAREGHILFQVLATREFIVQGGRNERGILHDQWAFDGIDWRPVPAPAPGRSGHAHELVMNSRRRELVFGGVEQGVLGDTLEHTVGGNWLPHAALSAPPAREEAAIFSAFSSNGDVALIFGGRDQAGNALGDTWQLDVLTQATVANVGGGCGPGPWGPSAGPHLAIMGAPWLGAGLEGFIMTPADVPMVLVVLGTSAPRLPVGNCGLLVQPDVVLVAPATVHGPGLTVASFGMRIPFDPGLAGTTWMTQAVVRDPATGRAIYNRVDLHLAE